MTELTQIIAYAGIALMFDSLRTRLDQIIKLLKNESAAVLQIKLKPDWPESSFGEYHQEAKKQLGLLWSLSDDATIGNCGNLKLLWSPTRWNWLL